MQQLRTQGVQQFSTQGTLRVCNPLSPAHTPRPPPATLNPKRPPHTHTQFGTYGRGRHLGISVAWRLRWRADGCFVEEIWGPDMGFKWGYDVAHGGTVWEVRGQLGEEGEGEEGGGRGVCAERGGHRASVAAQRLGLGVLLVIIGHGDP